MFVFKKIEISLLFVFMYLKQNTLIDFSVFESVGCFLPFEFSSYFSNAHFFSRKNEFQNINIIKKWFKIYRNIQINFIKK